MNDEPDEISIPEWVVTFGDMMSLLLTFFIMLVSLSEIKEEETYQALVNSVQESFGFTKTVAALAPGDSRPRQTAYTPIATTGRAMKKDTASGGVPEKAPTGEEPRVRIVRPGQTTAVGSVIYFDVGSDTLSPLAAIDIKKLANQLRGKPQKIEVRGHVSSEFAARTAGTDDAVVLGFTRATTVRRLLVNREGIDPARFRISSAGASEPASRTGKNGASNRNPRVEVFLLDETVEDLAGTADERDAEIIQVDDVIGEPE
jgi:chemotaxis protein MotB